LRQLIAKGAAKQYEKKNLYKKNNYKPYGEEGCNALGEKNRIDDPSSSIPTKPFKEEAF
jgi:hypothetical protein